MSVSPPGTPAIVLVVDDDTTFLRSSDIALRELSIQGITLQTGRSALAYADRHHFDMAIVDLRLPDMSGLDVVTTLHRRQSRPIVMVSAYFDTPTVVRALRGGACEAIDKPLDAWQLQAIVLASLTESPESPGHPQTAEDVSSADLLGECYCEALRMALPRARSSADRWANLVLRACDASADLKTIGEWARFTGVSYTSLCECSRIVGIRPHDSRDFTRVLRALIRMRRSEPTVHPQSLLNVADRRTLAVLLKRSGVVAGGSLSGLAIAEFLKRQTFIPRDSDAFTALLEILEHTCGATLLAAP